MPVFYMFVFIQRFACLVVSSTASRLMKSQKFEQTRVFVSKKNTPKISKANQILEAREGSQTMFTANQHRIRIRGELNSIYQNSSVEHKTEGRITKEDIRPWFSLVFSVLSDNFSHSQDMGHQQLVILQSLKKFFFLKTSSEDNVFKTPDFTLKRISNRESRFGKCFLWFLIQNFSSTLITSESQKFRSKVYSTDDAI